MYVKRSTKAPSPAGNRLLKRIFPRVENELKKVEDAIKAASKIFTARCFLLVRDKLRDVLSQDVAVLMNDSDIADHPIFNNEIFQSTDFALYREEKQQRHMSNTPDPSDNNLERCLPGMNSRFDTMTQAQNGLESNQRAMHGSINTLDDKVEQGFSQQCSFNDRSTEGIGCLCLSLCKRSSWPPEILILLCQLCPLGNTPVNNEAGLRDVGDLVGLTNYCLSFTHQSISDLYNEWYGLDRFQDLPCPGGIDALNKVHEHTWQHGYDSAESALFSKLKIIVDLIKNQPKKSNRSLNDVFQLYDTWWIEVGRNPSKMKTRL